MSISPWQCLLVFCSENGELFTTSLLPKPFHYSKIIVSHLLYKIRLGDLISFDGLVGENLDTEETAETDKKADVNNKKSSSKTKDRKMTTTLVSKKKRNQLINGVVDLEENYDDFFQKYYLVFDDAKKVFVGSGRSSDRNKKAITSPSAPDYLTTNDLVHPYAITNVSLI